MSGIALGAAYAAVQLVHQAHSKVKTSKARCARLVGRCQFVIDRLERIATTKGGDAIIRERIYELERAFEQTALTIVQVGRQGVIASLLRAEANALRIEACNEALTELIALFNLEEIVDVRRWQCDLEVARVRDHRELLSMGHRIESGNAAIERELAQQSDTIAQVLRGIHDINAAGLQNAHLRRRETLGIAIPLVDSDLPATAPLVPKAKVIVAGSGALPASGPPALYTPCASPRRAEEKPRWSTLRRLTLTRKCVKMVPSTKVFSSKPSPPSPFPSSPHLPSRGAAADLATGSSSPLSESTARMRPQGTDSICGVSCCDHPLPAEPPPPYQLRVVNPAPAASSESDNDHRHIHDHRGAAAAAAQSSSSPSSSSSPPSSSRFTAASIEAIRAPDSPVPTFPSPKLSTESVFGSTRSLLSLASVFDSESAPAPAPAPLANTNGTGTSIEPEPRYISTLRNAAAARGAAAPPPAPALRRKNTIGFARRVTLSSGLGLSQR